MNLYDSIGKVTTLVALRDSNHGLFLAPSMHSNECVLLPKSYCKGISIGDEVDVFLYTDSKDRIIATTDTPFARIDEIALLTIKDRVNNGLYFDIGLAKDIFMPCKNSYEYKDSSVIVRITKDKQHRLIAKRDISKLLKPCTHNVLSQPLNALAYKKSPLGICCVTMPHYYEGIIRHDNIKGVATINTFYNVRVSRIRRDAKLDLVINYNSNALLHTIRRCNSIGEGFCINNDISLQLNMSKKAIKKEISNLITKQQIYFIKDRGYFLCNSNTMR